MAPEVYHQAGHNTVWNLDSFRQDGAGDGVIIAPRYLEKEKVIHQFSQEPDTHIFDPQFLYPIIIGVNCLHITFSRLTYLVNLILRNFKKMVPKNVRGVAYNFSWKIILDMLQYHADFMQICLQIL